MGCARTYLDVFVLPVVFYNTADNAAFGVPEHHPSPCILLDGEQVQLLSNSAVVSSFSFLNSFLVQLQLSHGFPCSTVYALWLQVTYIKKKKK